MTVVDPEDVEAPVRVRHRPEASTVLATAATAGVLSKTKWTKRRPDQRAATAVVVAKRAVPQTDGSTSPKADGPVPMELSQNVLPIRPRSADCA
jgi:hypothetical protein